MDYCQLWASGADPTFLEEAFKLKAQQLQGKADEGIIFLFAVGSLIREKTSWKS